MTGHCLQPTAARRRCKLSELKGISAYTMASEAAAVGTPPADAEDHDVQLQSGEATQKPQAVMDAEACVAQNPYDTESWQAIMGYAAKLPAEEARPFFRDFLDVFPTAVCS